MSASPDKAWQYEQIRDVLAEYCERLDEYDIAGVAACFSADARADYGAGRGGLVIGRDAIAARIAAGQRPFRRTHHQLGQIRITLNEDHAEAVSYVTAWHELASGRKDVVCLRYYDKLIRDQDGWLITARAIAVNLVDGFEGTTWNWVKRRSAED